MDIDHIKLQAEREQKGMWFPSDGAKRLDTLFREVELMSTQLRMTLVQTRSKLQPFIDEGVIYKDRKIVRYKRDDEKMNHIDPEVEERIMNYKDKIQ